MRDPKRIERVLAKLQKVWEAHPDWRFGQLLWNIRYLEWASTVDTGRIHDPYAEEDDRLERLLDRNLDK